MYLRHSDVTSTLRRLTNEQRGPLKLNRSPLRAGSPHTVFGNTCGSQILHTFRWSCSSCSCCEVSRPHRWRSILCSFISDGRVPPQLRWYLQQETRREPTSTRQTRRRRGYQTSGTIQALEISSDKKVHHQPPNAFPSLTFISTDKEMTDVPFCHQPPRYPDLPPCLDHIDPNNSRRFHLFRCSQKLVKEQTYLFISHTPILPATTYCLLVKRGHRPSHTSVRTVRLPQPPPEISHALEYTNRIIVVDYGQTKEERAGGEVQSSTPHFPSSFETLLYRDFPIRTVLSMDMYNGCIGVCYRRSICN